MRSIGCIFVLLFLYVGCASAPKRTIRPYDRDPCVISDRVGEIIDADEREYYDLFSELIYIAPMTYRYGSASFHDALGEGYVVRIVTTKGILVSMINDSRGMAIITDYIDNYEDIKESRESFQEKWDIVAYDMFNLPITRHEIELTKVRMAAQARSSKRSPVLVGAAVGSCIGGAVAFAIAWASTDTSTANYPLDKLWEDTARFGLACLVGCLGGVGGGAVGGLVGSSIRGAEDARLYNAEDAVIIDLIRKQRIPRVFEE